VSSQRPRRRDEDQLIQMADAMLAGRRLAPTRPRRGRRRELLVAIVVAFVGLAVLAAGLLMLTPAGRRLIPLVPLVVSSPRLLVDAALSDRMVFPRDAVQALLLQQLAGRNVVVQDAHTQLIPPDRLVLTGRTADGPLRVDVRAVRAADGSWVGMVTGLPGTRGETRLDPASQLPAGQSIASVSVEPEQLVIELRGS
jgi:hypothetical protein